MGGSHLISLQAATTALLVCLPIFSRGRMADDAPVTADGSKCRSCEPAVRFNNVIVCEIPDSYATAALGLKGEVDLCLARKQHATYVETLRSTGVDVRVLKADEDFPDCVFVEDAAIIVEGHALLTKPGDPSRKNEVRKMRRLLRDQVGLPLMEIFDPEARLDGGDVLFTGREILVGQSCRTNAKGLLAVKEAFPGYPVTGVEVAGPLHLKTLLSLCGKDTLCASTESGDSITMLKRIDEASPFSYRRVIVPDDMSANTIFMNGTLICKAESEAPESFKVLQQQIGPFCKAVRGVELSEIEKAVGSLTCMSLRFNIPSAVKQVTQAKLVCRLQSEEDEE